MKYMVIKCPICGKDVYYDGYIQGTLFLNGKVVAVKSYDKNGKFLRTICSSCGDQIVKGKGYDGGYKDYLARRLGKSSGEVIIYALLPDSTAEQARAVITTYCMFFDIEVDTYDWDNLMSEIYNNYNNWFDSYDEFNNYMRELLV